MTRRMLHVITGCLICTFSLYILSEFIKPECIYMLVKKLTTAPSKNCDFQYKNCNPDKIPSWDCRHLLDTTNISGDNIPSFKPLINEKEHAILVEILYTFHKVCEAHNVSYMLYGGSLLGSYRHAGIIPWDDDIDILVNNMDRDRLKQLIAKSRVLNLFQYGKYMWKVSLNDFTVDSKLHEMGWPFLDVFLFEVNRTHAWNYYGTSMKNVFQSSDIFPVRKIPFENGHFNAPNKVLTMLKIMYGDLDTCQTNIFMHKSNQKVNYPVDIPCTELMPFFLFVTRNCDNGVHTKEMSIGETHWLIKKEVTSTCQSQIIY